MTTPKRERRKFTQLLYTSGAAFVGVIVALALAFVAIKVGNQSQKAATCSVIETSRAEKRLQLKAFDESPPTSEAGRNQQAAYRQSLVAWDGLWNQLNCKEARGGD
jgi:hypothetical protein